MFEITDSEKLNLASIVEKILAIEYISDNNLKEAMQDLYGKRESIFMLTMAISEKFHSLTRKNANFTELFGEKNIKNLTDQRNFLGHGYDSIKPQITLSIIERVLPVIKTQILENFKEAYELGCADFSKNIKTKKQSKNDDKNDKENDSETDEESIIKKRR